MGRHCPSGTIQLQPDRITRALAARATMCSKKPEFAAIVSTLHLSIQRLPTDAQRACRQGDIAATALESLLNRRT